MKSEQVKAYRVPVGAPVDVLVLEHLGNFYSFGCTCRSGESVWKEVKTKLDTLETCNEESHVIVEHFHESFDA